MLNDANGLPLSGGLLLAILIYALFSLFVSGQVIGERNIARSNWGGQCQAALLSEIETKRPDPGMAMMPKMDCNSILGLFGADGMNVCRRHGNFNFNIPMLDQIQAVERRKDELIEQRLAQAAARTGSRCGCAVSLTLENSRIPLAIWAGSARLITPPSIKNLNAGLMSALHSPQCALKG